MRIAVAGVRHWHSHYYYKTAARLPSVMLAGVSDVDSSHAQAVGAQMSVPAFSDIKEMVRTAKPDLVCLLGKHNEVAEQALWLVEQGVPFIVDKPGGMNFRQVAEIRDKAAARNHRIDTSFVYRVSDFHRHLSGLVKDAPVTWASFRLIGGGPERYPQSGNKWMLDPRQSGGGSTINLSVHFFDLFRVLTSSQPNDVKATMGSMTYQLPVEDYSSVILSSSSANCTVETGYSFPGPVGVWDLRFSIRTKKSYAILRNDNVLEVYENGNETPNLIQTASAGLSHWFPVFVEQAISRFIARDAPVATIEDLACAMAVVDAAYESNRQGGLSVEI